MLDIDSSNPPNSSFHTPQHTAFHTHVGLFPPALKTVLQIISAVLDRDTSEQIYSCNGETAVKTAELAYLQIELNVIVFGVIPQPGPHSLLVHRAPNLAQFCLLN